MWMDLSSCLRWPDHRPVTSEGGCLQCLWQSRAHHGGHNGHCPHGQRSNETGKWKRFSQDLFTAQALFFHVFHGLTIKEYDSCALVDDDFDLKRPLPGNFLAQRKKWGFSFFTRTKRQGGKKSRNGDTLGPLELIDWPQQGDQGGWR